MTSFNATEKKASWLNGLSVLGHGVESLIQQGYGLARLFVEPSLIVRPPATPSTMSMGKRYRRHR